MVFRVRLGFLFFVCVFQTVCTSTPSTLAPLEIVYLAYEVRYASSLFLFQYLSAPTFYWPLAVTWGIVSYVLSFMCRGVYVHRLGQPPGTGSKG